METGGFNLANHSEFLSIKRTNKLGTVRKAETGLSCHADVYVPKELSGISSRFQYSEKYHSGRVTKNLTPHRMH